VFIANDWHTALLPVYLKAYYRDNGFMPYARSVLVIHNIAHQVRFFFCYCYLLYPVYIICLNCCSFIIHGSHLFQLTENYCSFALTICILLLYLFTFFVLFICASCWVYR